MIELTDKQFGELSLQMLMAASVPGEQLEVALAYKKAAEKLISGDAKIEFRAEMVESTTAQQCQE